jgi:hypothetical protein
MKHFSPDKTRWIFPLILVFDYHSGYVAEYSAVNLTHSGDQNLMDSSQNFVEYQVVALENTDEDFDSSIKHIYQGPGG